ncbi:MAG: ferritin-like domain-containing protein [Nannocystaceae bacterium]
MHDEVASHTPRGVDTLFLSRLLRRPRGRALLLTMLADAETSDEGAVFAALHERVDDPELRRLTRRHADDELRHERMLRACAARQGVSPAPVLPPELSVTHCIDAHTGGIATGFLAGRSSVMEACLLLQVIEERAVRHFPRVVAVLRRFDPESAAVLEQVWRDECRHVGYAHAVARRYAPSPEALARTLAAIRTAERRAFAEFDAALLRTAIEGGWLEAGALERWAWRGIAALGRALPGGVTQASMP